ncbi:MAG: hypothetical protein ABTQ32_02415 [Myxococcaceae bacterium]
MAKSESSIAKTETPQPGVVLLRDGATIGIKVSLTELVPPEDAFQTDWYASDSTQGGLRCVFAKLSAGRGSVTGVVEITLHEHALRFIVDSAKVEVFQKELKLLSEKRNLAPTTFSLQQLSSLINTTTKEAAFVASFAFIAFTGEDAALSFFRVAPGAEMLAEKRRMVTPLVRIDTSVSILLAFLRDVRSAIKESP